MNKMLIIDNEPAFVNLAKNAFEAKSYMVATAESKIEGLEKLRREKPNIILLGTIVPQGSAFELHKEFKNDPQYKNIPILVIDASPENHVQEGWRREEGIMLEVEDYVSKPVAPDFLLQRVEQLLRR